MQTEYWLQEAKKLPFGGKAKIICCGTSPSMIINHTHKGFTGWCFRCGPDTGSKFHPHGELSIKEILSRKQASEELMKSPVYLPKDFTSELQTDARVWLLKAGISQSVSTFYNIGYSPYYRRVIIPVMRNGELDAFLARSVADEKPKYIARMRNPNNALFLSDNAIQYTSDDTKDVRNAYDIILVEDVLSAIRVGRIAQAGAILGTTVSDAVLQRIEQEIAPKKAGNRDRLDWWEPQESELRIAIWMDPDKAGKRASKGIERKLRLTGRSVQTISSGVDPKRLSDREIIETIGRSL